MLFFYKGFNESSKNMDIFNVTMFKNIILFKNIVLNNIYSQRKISPGVHNCYDF